ncbi:ABC transporter permease, partial [Methylobacterium radiotolerans]
MFIRPNMSKIAVFIGATISAQLEYRANFLGALMGTLVATGTSPV